MKLRSLALVAAATLGAGSAVAFAATLSVGSWHLWGGSQTLTKGTCTVPASGITDTYVNESSPNSSNGTVPTTLVRADAGKREWTFVRADLSSCALPSTAGADSATLKLVVKTTAGGGRTLTVTPVLSSWDNTLTWNGAQALTYSGSATTTFGTGTTNGATLSVTVTVDVDALIRNSSARYGWRITDLGPTTSGNTTTFNSSEGPRPCARSWLSTMRSRAAVTNLTERLRKLALALEPELPAAAGPSPLRVGLKRAWSVLSVGLVVGACVFWALALRPQSLGGPAGYVLVSGHSMLPRYHTGDMVLVEQHSSYHVGQVIAYRVPKGDPMQGAQVIHRIIGGDAKHGFVVQGDDRTAPDVWRPRLVDIVGAKSLRIPGAVLVLQFLRSPMLLGLLAASFVFVRARYPKLDL